MLLRNAINLRLDDDDELEDELEDELDEELELDDEDDDEEEDEEVEDEPEGELHFIHDLNRYFIPIPHRFEQSLHSDQSVHCGIHSGDSV